jgi:DNA-directed RNA polymerase alpha subunit
MTAVFSSSDKPLCDGQDPMSKDAPWREHSIDVLGLSVRAYNALRRAGIKTLGLLADSLNALKTDQLLNIKNVGIKTQSEISEKLRAYMGTLSASDLLNSREQSKQIVDDTRQISIEIPADMECSFDDFSYDETLDDATTRFRPAWHFYTISSLNLPLRLLNALLRAGYTTLGHLASLTEQSSPVEAHIKGIGWGSFIELKDKLSAYLASLPESAFELVDPTELESQIVWPPIAEAIVVSPKKHMAEWLSLLRDRDYQIIAWRYGFDGEPVTLDTVGAKLGLTRERVRQIENKLVKQLRHTKYNNLADLIMLTIAPAFERSGGVMSDDEVAAVASQLAPEGVDGLALMRLLSEVSEEFTRYNRAGVWARGVDIHLILDVQSKIAATLKAAKAPMKPEDIVLRLQENWYYHILRFEISEAFLRACVRTHPNLDHHGDESVGLASWAKHRLDEVILALRQIGQPAHYSEITEAVNKFLPEDMQTESHNIHAQMQRNPDIFVRVGQGTYGLAEWGLETAEFYPDIIERILRESGHPLSLQQVLSMVCEQRDCKESTVAMLLQFNDRFRSFPGGVYGLAEWHDDEFPDPSYREKRLVAAIADGEVRNKRKPKREIAQALQDVDDLISSARSNGPYES